MSSMRTIQRLRQVGESKIGCVFWTILLVLFIYVSWQMVPVKMKSIDLEQFMVRQVERASLQRRDTERQLHKLIMEQADELNLPLAKENLEVRRTGARVRVTASYTVPINLLVTTWDWKIKHDVQRSIMSI